METEIGERLRSERTRLGLKQQALGDKLGIGAQAISNWENGRTTPRSGTVQELASLGFDMVFVLTGRRVKGLDKLHSNV